MSVIIKSGNSQELANVASGSLEVNLPRDITKVGYVGLASIVDNGSVVSGSLIRQLDVSADSRLRIGTDSILWNDIYHYNTINATAYQVTTATMTVTQVGGFLNINAGSSVTSGHMVHFKTYKTFPILGTYPLYFDFWGKFNESFQANNIVEFGAFWLSTLASVVAPTDGFFFRVSAGIMLGVTNNAGTEQTVNLNFSPNVNEMYHYNIVYDSDRVEFWIDGILRGVIASPAAASGVISSATIPLAIRMYNINTVSLPIQFNISEISVSLGDLSSNRLWATNMVGMGNSAINVPYGATAGYTANYANSTVPVLATLLNTAAGYTTLGGQWAFRPTSSVEADYALFAYLVPSGSVSFPGKNLLVRGIRIETFVSGAVPLSGSNLLQWGIGAGSTAVSLVTADSLTAGTRAPRRTTLGIQYLPSASFPGFAAPPVDINLDAPIVVEPNTYFHVILKIPIGTQEAAGDFIRGTCFINGYFE